MNNRVRSGQLWLVIGVLVLNAVQVQAAADGKIVVAVLPCQSSAPEVMEMSRSIPTLLTASLSKNDKLDLVEREQLEKVLKEHELTLSGLVDPEKAAQLGKLIGAHVLILPAAFVMDKQASITAKVINVETGRVKASTKSTPLAKPVIAELVEGLTTDLVGLLTGAVTADEANAEQQISELVAELSKTIGDTPKPSVTLVIPEEHLRRVVPDPAVETELTYIFRKLHFHVIESESEELRRWAKSAFEGKAGKLPADLENVDVVIYGGAFSEDAGVRGDLHSSRARLELTALNVKNSEILSVNRGTTSAADTSAAVAGKSALQKVAVKVSKEFITDLIGEWKSFQKKNVEGPAPKK